MPVTRYILLALTLLLLAASPSRADQPAIGIATIAKWQDDSKAVFLLMFDDSWPSHFEVAIPALVERKMIATFYVNPGKGEYRVFKKKWEEEIPKTGMVYGNHTMTHKGVKDMDDAEREIGECTKIINDLFPDKKPRLISWGMPGVGKGSWNITAEQLKTLLEKHHLIDRPPFVNHGAVYHLKKTDEMLALADKTIKAGEMEYLVIHGVQRRAPMNTKYQDFWPLDQEVLFGVLDGLKERRDRGDLWITDHISYHQYLTERSTAKVETVRAADDGITLKLTCKADPKLYDLPLTLTVEVSARWKLCEIIRGSAKSTAAPKDTKLMLQAVPNGEPIEIKPIAKPAAS